MIEVPVAQSTIEPETSVDDSNFTLNNYAIMKLWKLCATFIGHGEIILNKTRKKRIDSIIEEDIRNEVFNKWRLEGKKRNH